jgi:hypothetical protein
MDIANVYRLFVLVMRNGMVVAGYRTSMQQ